MDNQPYSQRMSVPTMTDKEMRDNGFTEWRTLPDGSIMAVGPMSIANGRLYVDVHRTGYEDCFCYDSLELATAALRAFNPEVDNEPTGWKRHPFSGRRRPQGDASKEYVCR